MVPKRVAGSGLVLKTSSLTLLGWEVSGSGVYLGPFGLIQQNTTVTWLVHNQNLFFVVWKAGKSEIKASADRLSGEDLLQIQPFSLCVLKVGGAKELSGVPFTRAPSL